MAVTDYLQKSSGVCRYNYSKLKDVIYLISEEHLKNVHIDNGEAYIEGLTELPLRINGFNIQFNEETSLDERYKFQKTLTLSMHGYVNYKLFGGRHYAIIETQDGTFFMINVDFPSRITHTFNLSQNINQTDFTFACLSNFPTLKLNSEFEAVSPVCLGFNVYGIDKLQLIEKEKARLDTVNKAVISTEDFKTVEFLGNSCSFQEVYDGFKVTDTITFDIAFDNYKPSWQYNLLEFLENRYSAIITPKGGDNKYYPGYNFGLEPSYTIQTASQNGQSDTITVTLVEASIYGTTAANDWHDSQSGETRWRYVKNVSDIICYECIGLGRARYLVKQEVDYFGNPTGNYQVMEGYESQYPTFHIVGTFTTEEIFTENSCSEDETCQVTTTIPNTIYFNAVTCNTYTLRTSCDWRITDIPSNITVSPVSGSSNTDYNISICNTATPTQEVISNPMNLRCCMGVRLINMQTVLDASCIKPTTQSINCLGQTVTLTYDGTCRPTITSIDPRLTYQIGTNTITINVPKNTGSSAITWSITAINCECSSSYTTVTIVQDKMYEKWETDSGYMCESGNSYSIERKYTGTSENNYVRTEETRKGSLIQSGDTRCAVIETKWEWDGNYTCIGGDKYKLEEEYQSINGGAWVKTGNTRLGDFIESGSSFCTAVTYSWVLTDNWVCDSGDTPTPPTPPSFKWKVTYTGGSVSSAECDSTSAISQNEITLSDLGGVEIGNCCSSIGQSAFSGCTSLTSIDIPNSVTSIGWGAFGGCSGLTSCTIGDGVTSIGESAFESCSGLTSIDIPNSVTSIGNYAFARCTSLTSIVVPSGVTSIGNYAFQYCTGLTSCTIGDGVTSIGYNAFYQCSGLTAINIPSGVTSIGNGTFYNCRNLTSIDIPSGVTSIGKSAFTYCNKITEVTIPSGATSIDQQAFAYCNSLSSITIPDSVTSIGNSAFTWCSNLKEVTIPSGITYISAYTFYGCSGLTSIEIPESVTYIGSYSFNRCRGLTSIEIPSGVTNVYQYAFYNCDGLQSIIFRATTPTVLGSYSLWYTNDCPIYVPAESVDAYKAASGWGNYASRVQAIPT